MSDKYRKIIIGIVKYHLEEMRRCHKHAGTWVNDEIYNRCQSQVSILMSVLESVEKVNAGMSRTDTLVNLETRFENIRETLNA